MVKPTEWKCEICGSRYESEAEAKECEEQEIRPPLFKTGDSFGVLKQIFIGNFLATPEGSRLTVLSVKVCKDQQDGKNHHTYSYTVEGFGLGREKSSGEVGGWLEKEIESKIELGVLKKI